jgi:hypothetical protein
MNMYLRLALIISSLISFNTQVATPVLDLVKIPFYVAGGNSCNSFSKKFGKDATANMTRRALKQALSIDIKLFTNAVFKTCFDKMKLADFSDKTSLKSEGFGVGVKLITFTEFHELLEEIYREWLKIYPPAKESAQKSAAHNEPLLEYMVPNDTCSFNQTQHFQLPMGLGLSVPELTLIQDSPTQGLFTHMYEITPEKKSALSVLGYFAFGYALCWFTQKMGEAVNEELIKLNVLQAANDPLALKKIIATTFGILLSDFVKRTFMDTQLNPYLISNHWYTADQNNLNDVAFETGIKGVFAWEALKSTCSFSKKFLLDHVILPAAKAACASATAACLVIAGQHILAA